MPRYAPVMSLDDFKSLLIDFGKEHGDEDYLGDNEDDPTEIIRWALIEEKFSDAIIDMSKISFDFENLDVKKFTTLSNGVPIAYMIAGGDWEHPIYFALYYDGKKFRAYVPTKTNYYNHGTKTAYGNDDDLDFDDSKKHYGVKTEQEFLDFEFTEKDHIADFEKRIEVKGTYTYKGKNITPKSVLKKQEQLSKEVTFPKTGPIVASDLSVCVMPAATGSYVQFHTRESGRELNESELSRIVGVPRELERGGSVWYSNKSSKELADFMVRRGYTIHPESYLRDNTIRVIYMGRP